MSAELTPDLSGVEGIESLVRIFPIAEASSGPRLFSSGTNDVRDDKSDLNRWFRAQIKKGHNVEKVIADLQDIPTVEIAEPDYVFELVGQIPNNTTDPNVPQQWHLDMIRAREAWDYLESLGLPPGGSRDVVVAVIDSGVDYTHPDLAANMWVNRQEIADNGQDDDWNGFIDDVHGVSVLGDERDHSGDPMDLNGHGTHVAGIIAAVADNGIGGVGVAYNTRIMAIKAAQYNGTFYASDIAEAVYYAIENGADVINMSLSSGAHSKVIEDALGVAFGHAVLVAAAGNDGAHNEEPPKLPKPKPGFPASYIYCLGVMAQRPYPDSKDQHLADFSNWDNHPDSRIEYEVMAPGVDIFSTLPGDNYAAWDGTSMAAPVVSGIAALVRTKFPNKATHSSRFIMGQIASTGPIVIGKQFDENDYMAIASFGFQRLDMPAVDAYAALTDIPEPELAYLEHWLFDTDTQGPDNDDDGILDAGETVDLAIVIRNRWGKADNVVATLAPVARQGALPDPYVTMLTDTVDYGAVGSFNQDDNGLIYEDNVIVGVEFPFTFAVDAGTPNDHVVPFLLTMTCRNGLDPSDSRLYTFTSEFELVVQRGRELPKIISENMTLTKQHYWIIDQPTLIPEGVTVTVTEGTQIQFWSPVPRSPYSYGNEPSLLVEGNLIVRGTADEPVELFPSERYWDRLISIKENDNGRVTMEYVCVMNPVFGRYEYEAHHYLTLIDHAYFTQWGGPIYGFFSGEEGRIHVDPQVYAFDVENSIFDGLGATDNYWADPLRPWEYAALSVMNVNSCLFDSCHIGDSRKQSLANNTFLGNYLRYYSKDGESIQVSKVQEWGARIDPDTIYLTDAPVHSFQGHTYFALNFGYCFNLYNAQEFAQTLGGNVASLHSQAEHYFAADAMNHDPFALGMTYSATAGQAIWIDGSSVDYTPGFFLDDAQPHHGEVVIDWGYEWAWYSEGNAWPFLIKVPGAISRDQIETELAAFKAAGTVGGFENNAFLNEWWNPDINYWMRFFGEEAREGSLPCYLTRNYWGTTSTTLIDAAIHDWWDQFDLTEVIYEPILEEPPETTYPFVVDVNVAAGGEYDLLQVGAGEITFTLTFNRDMNTSVQPEVSFGPDVPFSDYLVNPVGDGWTGPRIWVGQFEVTPITGDGWQYIRVADAVAVDDPWLKTGNDERRFRFEIITGGLASIDMQATPGPGCIDLTWHQDDFQLFAGFNLYRATEPEPNGVFTRLNATILSAEQNSYRDADVQPNTTYYYKYAVVTTDMSESDFSNTVSAMPLEVNPPQIQHQPITTAEPDLSVTFRAVVTDETGVASVSLYYRQAGQSEYLSRDMVLTYNDRYSVTLEGTLIKAPGLEYYIEATDGLSVATSGSAISPYLINVVAAGAPQIIHEPPTDAESGEPLSIYAQATDDVQVDSVTVFYRKIDETTYQSQSMTHMFGDFYYATIPGSMIMVPGLEYYIEASDGTNTTYHGLPTQPVQINLGSGTTGIKLDNTSDETEGYDEINEYNLAVCQDFLATFDAGIGSTIEVTFLADGTTSTHNIFLAPYDAANTRVDYANPISTTVASNPGTGSSDDPLAAIVTLTSPIYSGTRYAACIVPSVYMQIKLTLSASSIDGQSSKFIPPLAPDPEVERDTDFRIKIDVKT
jgi:subtilisin family serine protease